MTSRTFTSLAAFDSVKNVGGVKFPYSMAWLEGRQIALMATQNKKAFVYALDSPDQTLSPTGDTYVLSDVNVGPFAHDFAQPPQYSHGTDLFPLLPLSLNSLALSGSASNQQRIDSGASRGVWHRLYLEASVPQRCGVVVWLAAADDPKMLDDPTIWFPHVFGDVQVPDGFPDAPRGVWQRVPSEVAFDPGLLGEAPQGEQ
jgi:hypothetical protein